MRNNGGYMERYNTWEQIEKKRRILLALYKVREKWAARGKRKIVRAIEESIFERLHA